MWKAQNTCKKNEKVKKFRDQNVFIHAMWTIRKGKKGCLFVSMLKLAPIVFFYFWNNIKIQLSKIEHQATDKTYFKEKYNGAHKSKEIIGV